LSRAPALEKTLDGIPARVVLNERSGSEMAESARAGLRTAAKKSSSSGFLIALADHPMVSMETIKSLCRCHAENPEKIIIPAYKGKRGHPTLFPRPVVEEIFSSGLTLRDLIKGKPDRMKLLEVPDEGVLMDLDTMEDYQRIKAALEQRRLELLNLEFKDLV
jgi:CTP:molybdopterin cytidylyltransferase MocA